MKQGIALLLFCVFLFGMFFFFWGSDRETVVPSTPEERTKSVAEESANTEKNSMTKTATFKIKIEYCTS